ncbi:MAG: sigma 54-interacting transcriptional regulator [Chloroflexota bacterium]
MVHVLIVSNDAVDTAAQLRSEGYALDVYTSHELASALQQRNLKLVKYALALVDLEQEEWRQVVLDLRSRLPVVAMSKPDTKAVVEAMKLGASDYVEKPLNAAGLRDVVKPNDTGPGEESGLDGLVGMSAPMREVFSLIKRAAMSESNVLITGESGTGKEPVARAIHRWSPRRERSFTTINCSAIPDTLLESELFGFEKGAFTGANYTKKGIFELADGGTAFLDEIGDVSPLFQTKVLRVLQEGEIMRIGGMRHMRIDVRVIAATNRDLRLACKKGTFREDLFYRLNVINIHLPPLRDRMEDVPILVKHFIEKHGPKRKDILVREITDDALNALMGHVYPGNVRELENIIERAISFAAQPIITLYDLPKTLFEGQHRKRAAAPLMKEALASYEREIIWSALQEAQGNISKAAASLGIYRQQLQRKIRKLKIAT